MAACQPHLILPPPLPIQADTMNSALTAALQAQWLAQLLEGDVQLPSR